MRKAVPTVAMKQPPQPPTVQPRKARKKPDFSGVAGEVVRLNEIHTQCLQWGNKTRVSLYDALLEKLLEAPKDSALRFGDVRARASVSVRARKKGLKVEYAEDGGVLYVRIVGFAEDADAAKKRRRKLILESLQKGPKELLEITKALRADDVDIDAGIVKAICEQLRAQGELLHDMSSGTYRLARPKA